MCESDLLIHPILLVPSSPSVLHSLIFFFFFLSLFASFTTDANVMWLSLGSYVCRLSYMLI